MFIQVITGEVADRGGLEAAFDRWEREQRPGATGFLGATGGVTPDGRFIELARFESAEAAAANSDRPEQGQWWQEAEKCFAGPVTFHDCTEIDTFGAGGSDEAGFVQVMQGHADRQRLLDLDRRMEGSMAELRPDLIGSIRAWDGDQYTEAAYFVSEAEARVGEAKGPPPDVQEALEEWQQTMGEVTFYDLPSPRFLS
jgi:hypothetical protein